MSARDAIPTELRERPQWVVWRFEDRNGRPATKVPYDARTGRQASTTNPATWTDFSTVVGAAEHFSGIGFVFSEDDPYAGIDIDECLTDGELHAGAAKVVQTLDSYTEISPSGHGVKIIVRAEVNGTRHATTATPWGDEFAIFDRRRFFAITGRMVEGTPPTIEPRQSQFDRIVAEMLPPRDARANGAGTQRIDIDDRELVARARKAENGTKFSALWDGDSTDYASASEGDLALCNMLAFWTGRDPERMDRLFGASGRMRTKWSRTDYRQRTINAAIASCREVYGPQKTIGTDERPALTAIPIYPVEALPRRAQALVASGLPTALMGGSVLAALAGAIGGNVEVRASSTWTERAILWVVNIAPRGAGKSPAQRLAFAPLRDHDAELGDDTDAPPSIRVADLTTEALARALHARAGAAVVDLDELAVMLRGFGEYKRGGGGDRGRLLSLWGGDPWRYERVGGGTAKNKISLSIPRPTLVVCGSLQTPLHELLGVEEDGLRPRWLPHLSPMPQGVTQLDVADDAVTGWATLIDVLLDLRGRERRWTLSLAAVAAFNTHRERWQAIAQGRDTGASVAAAAVKAPGHLLRIALVLAEAEKPGQGGSIGAKVVDRAALIVDFSLGCWAALPEQGAAEWLSRRDAGLDRGVTKLVAWLEERGGEATRREVQKACVAGVRNAKQLDDLLAAYDDTFPGCTTKQRRASGGAPTVVVRAPTRTAFFPTVGTADTEKAPDESARSRAENGGVGTADSARADSAADSGPRGQERRS